MMNQFRSLLLALTVLLTFAEGKAQLALTKSEIQQDVMLLLEQYQQKIALIKPGAVPDPIRDFTALFSSPRVKVINNLTKNPTVEELIIQDYAENLRELYPTGVNVTYNRSSVRFGMIVQEFGSQYAVAVRFYLTLSAFPGGTVFENRKLLEFKISFNWDGEKGTNFKIARIDYPDFNKKQLGLFISGGSSRMTAPWMTVDERSQQLPKFSGAASVQFTYWLTPEFGLGTGIGGSYLTSDFTFDRFNQFEGRDPNISDVHMYTDFYMLDWPVFASYSVKVSDRVTWRSQVGLRFSYRYWSSFYSSGVQTLLDNTLQQVITYSDYQNDVSSLFVSGTLASGAEITLSRSWILSLGIEGVQGVKPIDRKADSDFEMNRYRGQYNPLWMDPETRNLNQFAGFVVGLQYLFDQKVK